MKEQKMSIEQVRAMIKGMRTELEDLEKAEFYLKRKIAILKETMTNEC